MFPDFGLPPDIVGAALGGLGVEEVVGLEAKASLIIHCCFHCLIRLVDSR